MIGFILIIGVLARIIWIGQVPGGIHQDEAYSGYEAPDAVQTSRRFPAARTIPLDVPAGSQSVAHYALQMGIGSKSGSFFSVVGCIFCSSGAAGE